MSNRVPGAKLALIANRAAAEKNFWLEQLSEPPEKSSFPFDFSKENMETTSEPPMKIVNSRFNGELFSKLNRASNNNDVKLNMILAAGLIALVSRYTGSSDIIIGTPIYKQPNDGPFINTVLVLRNRLTDGMTFKQLLLQVRETLNNATKNQNYPIDLLAGPLNLPVPEHESPFFDTAILLHNIHHKEYLGKVHYQMLLAFDRTDGHIAVEVEFNASLYRRQTVEQITGHFGRLLEQALSGSDPELECIDLLSEQEKQRIVDAFNANCVEYPADKTFHEWAEIQTEKDPDRVAVTGWGGNAHLIDMTYRELNLRSTRLASLLKERGVRRGTTAAVMLERRIEMVTSILAIMKAGGAYLPVDPNYPLNRSAYMMKDSDTPVLLTTRNLSGKIAFEKEIIYLEHIEDHHVTEGILPELPHTAPHDPAYVIYTSGSTGKPKGVMVQHNHLVNAAFGWRKEYRLLEIEVNLLQMASFSFDVFAGDLARTLLNGGRMVVNPELGTDPASLYHLIASHRITLFESTPSYIIPFMNYVYKNNLVLHSLRLLILGSDTCPSRDFKELIARFGKQMRILNSYGVTEATIDSSYYEPVDGECSYPGSVPIGKPLPNVKFYILDRNGNLLPVGVPGELCIGGDGVARGYLNNPGLTAEKFSLRGPGALCRNGEGKLYKTGDLARWLPDGNMEFLGRGDTQVKVRGYRIELGEIESKLLEHEDIDHAVVVQKAEKTGDKYLCGYIVSGKLLEASVLRDYLADKLPDYMIPWFFVQLEHLPLTPNGKIDRRALPDPEPGDTAAYIAPRTPMEKEMAMMWSEVLSVEVEKIGIDTGFFNLGGNSLKAIILVSRMKKQFGIETSLEDIFNLQTIRAIAGHADGTVESSFAPIAKAEKKEYYPAASAQHRLYILQQIEPGSTSYNISTVIRMEGRMEGERLEKAFVGLMQRHAVLRTSFEMAGGELVQKVHETVDFGVRFYDGGEMGGHEEIIRGFIRPFSLDRAPLFRVGLIKTGEDQSLLLVDMHHIITDGVSMGVLITEFASLYEGVELPELRLDYVDFAEWERGEKAGERVRRQEAFWLGEFGLPGGIPLLDLPVDHLRPAVHGSEGHMINVRLEAKERRGLESLALKHGATLYMVLLAAYDVLLYKLSGQEEIVVGTPTAGRSHADLESLVGMFVNTLVLKNYPSGEKRFIEFLKEVKEKVLKAFSNQDYQYDELVDKVLENRDPGRNPLFDTMFILQNQAVPTIETSAFKVKPYDHGRDTSKFDLTLECIEVDNYISCNFEYSTKLFMEETMTRFAGYFKQIAAAVVENPDTAVMNIDVLTEQEKKRLIVDFNDTARECPRDKTIYRLLEEQVDRYPDHAALVFKDNTMTFRLLDEKANRLANYLCEEKGFQTGDRAAVLMDRSFALIVSLVGVMKAGGAYVPLDPSLPGERLRVVFNDATVGIVLSHQRLREKLTALFPVCPAFHTLWCPDGETVKMKEYEVGRRGSGDAGDAAYIMYTSGSSGIPKGVLVTHRTIVNTLWWRRDFYGYRPGSVSLQNPPYFFDSSVTDIFTPLLGGARLVLIEEDERKDLSALRKIIRKSHVTHFIAVPAFYNIMLEEIAGDLGDVKMICAAGEHFPDELVKKHFRKLPGVRITNEYGPTENSVNTTIYELTPRSEKALIGKPIWNVAVSILDRHMRLCPTGAAGEICLSGDSLAEGYLNTPELTAEKFCLRQPEALFEKIAPGPHKNFCLEKNGGWNVGGKVYRTGDLARWRGDGNLEFLGRVDTQVKIRGMRIETGEIESHVMKYPGIKEAVVLARENRPGGDKYLCAYIVPAAPGETVDTENLQEHLSQRLPQHMVPPYFVVINAVPFTAAGKIDRAALPAPETNTAADLVSPRDEREKRLTEVWSEVLGKSPIGIDDNFFSLGGDSIKAIQIISRLNGAGYRTDIRTLFQHPTVRKLTPRLTVPETVRDQSPVTGEVPLTPIQEWFFRGSPLFPHQFNRAVMLYSAERLEAGAVRAVFAKIQEHHDALRMTFAQAEERWIQINHGLDYPVFYREYDLRGREDSSDALTAAADVIQASIDLETGPLIKPVLFHLDDGDRLLVAIHHLVIDGISWRILLEDIDALLRQYKNNEPLTLPLKTDSFKRWAEKLQEYAADEALAGEAAYWREQAVPGIETDTVRGDNFVRDAAAISFDLEPEQTEKLLTKANHAFGTEIEDILLTALGIAVRETWKQDRLFLMLEGHGRADLFEDIDVSRTVGWFTVHYPVLLDFPGGDDREQLLREMKETRRKVPNKGIGYGILKYPASGNKRNRSEYWPEPRFIFNYLGQFNTDPGKRSLEIAKEKVGALYHKDEKRQFELEITGAIRDGRLTFITIYSKKLYEPGMIETLMRRFNTELDWLIEFCASRETREFTPSDFTYPHLPAGTLDALIRRYDGSIEDIYTMTPMQQGMLFHTVYTHTTGAYFEQVSYRLEGDLDVALVQQALDELFRRHDILRTVFVHEGVETPLQVVLADRRADVYVEDFREKIGAGAPPDRLIDEFKAKDKQLGFDPGKDVLMRVSVLRTGRREYEIIWSCHHILMDGWCIGILNKEFFDIHMGLRKDREPRLPVVIPYKTYIRWLEKQDGEASLSYWREYLEFYDEAVQVPGKKARKDPVEYRNETRTLAFDSERSARLTAAAGKNHVTLNTVFQSLWAVLLGKYNDKEDVLFGSVVSGRPGELEGVESMVGLFINTIPVRIRFSGQTRFRELVRNVQADALAGEPHHYHPLAEIQAQSSLKADLIDHILIYENYPTVELVGGYEDEANPADSFKVSNVEVFEQTNYDFNVVVTGETRLELSFNFNAAVFDADFVVRIAEHFGLLVDQVLDDEEIEIEALSILSPREKEQILYEFNDTEMWYPHDKTIHDAFEGQAVRTPDAVAVCGPDRSHCTYNRLKGVSDNGAVLLRQEGVRPGRTAALMPERSIEMIVVLLAILKAGGTYLPIDPAYPRERIDYILADSAAKLVPPSLPTENPETPENLGIIPDGGSGSSDPAYIIYTSGSTGRPKGVLVRHSGVMNMVTYHREVFGEGPQQRMSQVASIGFDAMAFEIWPCLLSGASLVIADDHTRLDPFKMKEWLIRSRIAITFQPTALAEQLLDQEWPGQGVELRALRAAGDRLTRFPQRSYPFRLYNLYGPTEDTVWTTWTEVPISSAENGYPHIGKPVGNHRVYIVDPHLNLRPVGIPGELCIAGEGLADGYLNNLELTVGKFCLRRPGTFLKKGSWTSKNFCFYKTGDLARWRPDGNIEFLGRIDHQVKIRGFRIELEEIDSRLRSFPGTADAVTVKREDNGIQYLCAYFTVKANPSAGSFPVGELKNFLDGQLPAYMVPTAFVRLDTIPLSPNGKVDRRMLPPPSETDFHTGSAYVAPSGDLQQTIAETWKEVLGREKVGIHDNFFDLGGTSLDFIKISNKLKEKMDREVPVVTLMTYPTIGSLALFLAGGGERPLEEESPGLIDEGKDLMRFALNKLDDGDE